MNRSVALSFLLLMGLLSFNACQETPCENTNCVNGTCIELTGFCECNEGYEGADCSVATREKYLGTYSVAYEGCFTTSPNHTIGIEQFNNDVNKVYINDLGDYECPEGAMQIKLEADIDSLRIVIPSQTIDCGVIAYTFEGEGTLQGSILTLGFKVNYDADGIPKEDNCVATLEK